MTEISPVQTQALTLHQDGRSRPKPQTELSASKKTDSLSLSGPTSRKDVAELVLEKTFSHIRNTGSQKEAQNIYQGFSSRDLQNLENLVQNAKTDLGLSSSTSLDVSPEATANRIVDFALLAFSQFQRNHGDLNEEEVRTEFVEFIGKAIGKGVEEARDILTSLNALSPEVDADISTTVDIINERLQEFAEQETTNEPSTSQATTQETAPHH